MSSRPQRAPIVVLISGRGSNMRALVERSREPAMGYEVSAVLSDNPAANGLALARDLGVTARALAPAAASDRAAYELELAAAIDEHAPSLITLAGFMRILSAQFVARYAGRMLNIHPSLLPKFPGLHTHRRALEAHEAQHGATVHFVTEQLDGGPPVIQAQVKVEPDDDEDSLAARVQSQEHRIYPLAVHWYCTGRLRYAQGRAWLDGAPLCGPVQYGAERRPEVAE
ncbi:MAG: phosphoribosylglycinamide formyltransferase [Steroidobacteraceae bacterium]